MNRQIVWWTDRWTNRCTTHQGNTKLFACLVEYLPFDTIWKSWNTSTISSKITFWNMTERAKWCFDWMWKGHLFLDSKDWYQTIPWLSAIKAVLASSPTCLLPWIISGMRSRKWFMWVVKVCFTMNQTYTKCVLSKPTPDSSSHPPRQWRQLLSLTVRFIAITKKMPFLLLNSWYIHAIPSISDTTQANTSNSFSIIFYSQRFCGAILLQTNSSYLSVLSRLLSGVKEPSEF